MKATELMIGDWIADIQGNRMRVVNILSEAIEDYYYGIETNKGFVDFEDAQPIPLTAEILNKNFPKPRGEYWVDGVFPSVGYSIPCHTDGYCPYVEVSIYDPARVMEFEMYFHYVHELQHALRLCGIEKEIEL